MRKGRDGGNGKNGKKKTGKKKKRWMKIVVTMSLPAVDCPNADRWNAARSCTHDVSQYYKQGVLQYHIQDVSQYYIQGVSQ